MGADQAQADEQEFSRQEQIWAGLYGPPRAAEMIASARAARQDDPTRPIKELLASFEPSGDDDDLDEAGTMRPI